jgi:hypothetical protein
MCLRYHGVKRLSDKRLLITGRSDKDILQRRLARRTNVLRIHCVNQNDIDRFLSVFSSERIIAYYERCRPTMTLRSPKDVGRCKGYN